MSQNIKVVLVPPPSIKVVLSVGSSGSGSTDSIVAVGVEAAESGDAFDQIQFYDDAGTKKFRKADAGTGKRSDGYPKVNYVAGQTYTIYRGGIMTGFSGIEPGEWFFLGSSGEITTTPPTEGLRQRIAYGMDSSQVRSVIESPETFLFSQAVASAVWNISHGMGRKPSVKIFDGSGEEVLAGVTHTDEENLQINFISAMSGQAILT